MPRRGSSLAAGAAFLLFSWKGEGLEPWKAGHITQGATRGHVHRALCVGPKAAEEAQLRQGSPEASEPGLGSDPDSMRARGQVISPAATSSTQHIPSVPGTGHPGRAPELSWAQFAPLENGNSTAA